MRLYVLVFSAALVAACGPSSMDGDGNGNGNGGVDAGPGGGGGGGFIDANTGGGSEFADAAPVQACTKMDILFVVDDSGSMAEEQSNLAANFPQFMNLIESYTTTTGEPLDYHVGVTTTGRDLNYTMQIPGFPFPLTQNEKGDNGVLRQSCNMQRRWLMRGDSDVAGTFACAAKVGTGGPSIEMPLYATQLATDARIQDGTNAGFLRDDALLAIVVLTDEDDCSREDNNFTVATDACEPGPNIQPVDKYIAALDGLKGERGRWAAAIIAGETNCESSFGKAFEAKRLKDFVQKTGKNAVFSSICEGDLTKALQDALDTFEAACASFPPVD